MALVPLNKVNQRTLLGAVVYRDSQRGFKLVPKKRPLPTMIPYERDFESVSWVTRVNTTAVTSVGGNNSASAVLSGAAFSPVADSARSLALNSARDKLKGRISPSAALGVAAVEARESLDLIVKRVNTLRDAYKAARKGNVRSLKKILGISRDRRSTSIVRHRSHQASDLWLEHWFGWAPLFGDISDAVSILGGDPPPLKVSARSVKRFQGRNVQRTNSPPNDRTVTDDYNGSITAKHWAVVRVTNPNLFLANQLGLVNVAAIAWESVPFSFIADWFSDIGTFIDSWTDFVGLSFESGGTLIYSHCVRSRNDTTVRTGIDPLTTIAGDRYDAWSVRRGGLDLQYRVQGFKLPGNLSTTRAATSISLLVKLFTKSR